MITSALRKMLLTLGYPKLEKSHHLVGPHTNIGAFQVRIPYSVNCQIFYPAASLEKEEKDDFVPYWRPKAVQGLIEYLGFGDGLLQLLSETPHPCRWEANPLLTTTTHDFPLVLFSHGLAGTMEMYTELCQHMASLGYCVVAVEHEDGSAAYAETNEGEAIPYTRPDDTPYSRQKVLKLRTPMLQQRVQEMESVVRFFQSVKQRASVDDDLEVATLPRLLSQIVEVTDPFQLHLVGHSFGGATQMLAAQHWTCGSGTHPQLQPTSLTVLDSWAFALQEQVVQEGLKKRLGNDELPFLSIISEGWTTNPETQQIVEFLQNSLSDHVKIHSFVAQHSVHQSFSDSEAWFPSPVAKRVYNRGKKEPRHETIRGVVKAWGKMVMGKDDGVIGSDDDDVLQPFSFHSESQVQKHPTLQETEATVSSISAVSQ
jgi:platelet-activating factor acetylhydrolase